MIVLDCWCIDVWAQVMRCVRIAASKVPERLNELQGVLSQYEAERVTRRVRRQRTGQTSEGVPLQMDKPMLATKVTPCCARPLATFIKSLFSAMNPPS